MSIAGIVAEYNPFHNGHLYHLKKTKEIAKNDFTVAVMSGNFLQRGEPAILDKWVRTNMALNAGVDLVIELPFVFATQYAKKFAQAAVKILNDLNVIDYISFGCEETNLDYFYLLAKLLKDEPDFLSEIIKAEFKKGFTYPKVIENAVTEYYLKNFGHDNFMKIVKNILKYPNNILALEYLQSLLRINSPLKPILIKRIGSNYSKNILEGKYSSATAVRKKIIDNYHQNLYPLNEIKSAIPDSSYQIFLKELNENVNPVSMQNFEIIIMAILRRITRSELKNINGINEGLENRIIEEVINSYSIESLIQNIKTKRYTRTKIQRILIHSMFNITRNEIDVFNESGPLYCRILGFNNNGKKILKKIKNNSKIPVIIKFASFIKNNKDPVLCKMINYDILSTKLYTLAYQLENKRFAGKDFTSKPIILEN